MDKLSVSTPLQYNNKFKDLKVSCLADLTTLFKAHNITSLVTNLDTINEKGADMPYVHVWSMYSETITECKVNEVFLNGNNLFVRVNDNGVVGNFNLCEDCSPNDIFAVYNTCYRLLINVEQELLYIFDSLDFESNFLDVRYFNIHVNDKYIDKLVFEENGKITIFGRYEEFKYQDSVPMLNLTQAEREYIYGEVIARYS